MKSAVHQQRRKPSACDWIDLVVLGRFREAADQLAKSGSTPHSPDDVMALLGLSPNRREIDGAVAPIDFQLTFDWCFEPEAKALAEHGTLPAQQPSVAVREMLQLVEAIANLVPDLESWVLRATLLRGHLKHLDELSLEPDPGLVNSFLSQPPKEGLTLCDVLADTRLNAPVGNDDDALIGQKDAVRNLLGTAALAHCPAILACASPAPGPWMLEAIDLHSRHRKGRLKPESFRSTLQVLKDKGVDLAKPFHIGSICGTLLHRLAQSDHPDKIQALQVALEEGCDPRVPNERGWLAHRYMDQSHEKDAWLTVERSHLARQAAVAALTDMNPTKNSP